MLRLLRHDLSESEMTLTKVISKRGLLVSPIVTCNMNRNGCRENLKQHLLVGRLNTLELL